MPLSCFLADSAEKGSAAIVVVLTAVFISQFVQSCAVDEATSLCHLLSRSSPAYSTAYTDTIKYARGCCHNMLLTLYSIGSDTAIVCSRARSHCSSYLRLSCFAELCSR
jgi:hypothetical protein